MALQSHGILLRNGAGRISRCLQSSARRCLAVPSRRHQNEGTSTTRNSEITDTNSPVRMKKIRYRKFAASGIETTGLQQDLKPDLGLKLPPNPNNHRSRDEHLKRQQVKVLESNKEVNPPTDGATKEPVPHQIGALLDDKTEYFSPVLLRDLCTCPSCLDPSTKQKLFSTTDIPSEIKATAVVQDSSNINLVWENDVPGYDADHATVLEIDTLRALKNSNGAPSATSGYDPGQQLIWDAEQYQQLEDFEYEDYMHDDLTLFRALQQLHMFGMLFLRNVPEDETSVSTIAERIGPLKNTFYGYTWDVRSVPEASNVANTSSDLGFHMDLLYMYQPPHLQFLHAVRPSASGGASVFADSYKAAADLFSSDFDAFVDLAVLPTSFQYNHPSGNLYQQSHVTIKVGGVPHFTSLLTFVRGYRQMLKERGDQHRIDAARAFQNRELKVEDHIQSVAWSPPFQAPFRDLKWNSYRSDATRLSVLNEKATRWHAAMQKFNNLLHRHSSMYERMMRPGECVIFDNRRVVHARKAFEAGDVGKERWLRGAYLDWDPYWSKMQVLGRKFGGKEVAEATASRIIHVQR